jgi:hypothetical protein
LWLVIIPALYLVCPRFGSGGETDYPRRQMLG